MAKSRSTRREAKHLRTKTKLSLGTAERPRLNVFKSLQNFEAQLIDDVKRVTLASVSTKTLELPYGGNTKAATAAGEALGKKILALKIDRVVFDRGGYIYHGRVKAFAEAVRAAGVKF